MELKGIGIIEIALNSWLKKYGFTARIRGIDEDFFWNIDDDTISYSLVIDNTNDCLTTWNALLEELQLKYVIDPFYSIFLHEVFHSETYHTLSDEEIDESEEMKRLIQDDPSSFAEDIHSVYYHLPVEIEATLAAVEYINTYPERVRELINIVSKAINQFYRLNNVEK